MAIVKNFNAREDYWVKENIKFFGIQAREWEMLTRQEIADALKEDADKYWNSENPCELMEMVANGKICRGEKFLQPKSIFLRMNNISECIDVYGDFKFVKKDKEEILQKLIMSMPTPHINLSWIICKKVQTNRTKWTPRITCFKDYSLVRKEGNKVYCNAWEYDLTTSEFKRIKRENTWAKKEEKAKKVRAKPFNPLEGLTYKSKRLLMAIMGDQEITEDNLKEALEKLPEFNKSSIYTFNFLHLEAFFNYIKFGKRFASPMKGIPLPIHVAFLQKNESIYDVNNKLVITESPMSALENFNTVVYDTKEFGFLFSETKLFFDAFRTSTNKGAGKQRLLLDNIFIRDGMLWMKGEDGKEYDMYQLMVNPDLQTESISNISHSLFCNNNAPKRIMMTAKASAQSVPVIGQEDPFTNRVKARVVFGEIKGWTFADSIIISESFAEKLRSKQVLSVNIDKDHPDYERFLEKIKNEDNEITTEDLYSLRPGTNQLFLKSYENCKLVDYEIISKNILNLKIRYEIPFLNGDKITNLHGSKGVVGAIVPDNEMPKLKESIGDFEAGPFDIVMSSLSVIRRKALGQIFEAWAIASGIEFKYNEDFIAKAVEKYRDQMKDFSSKSIIEFQGKESIKPCGIINIIRLQHHASLQSSTSYLKANSDKMLKFSYMEELNLVANNCTDILEEFGIRSMRKHASPYTLVYEMMTSGILPRNPKLAMLFNRLLRCLGVDMTLSGKSLVNIDSNEPDFVFQQMYRDTINNNKIDLLDLFNNAKEGEKNDAN